MWKKNSFWCCHPMCTQFKYCFILEPCLQFWGAVQWHNCQMLIHISIFAAPQLNRMKYEMNVLVLIMYRWRWNKVYATLVYLNHLTQLSSQLYYILCLCYSYLKLYTTLPLSKLATFMGQGSPDENRDLKKEIEALIIHLLCFKHKMKNVVWTKGTSGLEGKFQSGSEASIVCLLYSFLLPWILRAMLMKTVTHLGKLCISLASLCVFIGD